MNANSNTPPHDFYAEMALHCQCCLICSDPPCEGVCAGGICDQRCRCDDWPVDVSGDDGDDDGCCDDPELGE